MKKLLTLFLLCVASAAFAQDDLKPVQGDMGITFGFNGLQTLGVTTNFESGSTLLFRYYLEDDMAFRARLNLTMTQNKSEFSDTSGFSETDITKNHGWSVEVGVQKDFAPEMKHIQPYVAADIRLGSAKNGIIDNTSSTDNTHSLHFEVDPGNTFSFGLIGYAGFNYFFTNHFAVGAEFGYGIGTSSTSEGKTTTTTTDGNLVFVDESHTAKLSSWSISGDGGEALILISVFFGH